ncbi:MAG: phosphate ABC transporter permease subunit PstC [Firmicutes bacterium]|nr:phosphate ABC transporter permease subunit PstC [Bacillota bacterium]
MSVTKNLTAVKKNITTDKNEDKFNRKGRKTVKEIVKEIMIEKLLFFCAFVSLLSLILITVYILIKGTPIIFKIGFFNFVFGRDWNPTPANGDASFGILPMVAASLLATLGSVFAGTLIGIFTAIFLSEIAPVVIVKLFKPAIELLAGIPSVVYGFFGLVVIVPLIRTHLAPPGNSLLAAIIILTFMILPTIINISETAIRTVPVEYREGSLALGATHIQTIFRVILPAARSGIMASIVLGMGRAIGETMAVILVAGNSTLMPKSLLSPVRTLTANIALEMGYAFGEHENALFATGVILFLFIMALNIIFNVLVSKTGKTGCKTGKINKVIKESK